MKAAIVRGVGKMPEFGEFPTPVAKDGEALVRVRASALSNLAKGRASGAHYSANGVFPLIPGVDGVGMTEEGRRVYFVLPEAPYGAMAEFCPMSQRKLVEIPEGMDDVTAAAIANPGMSVWGGLVERGGFKAGETVLVNGATSTSGRLAVQIAKYLGATKVIGTGRNEAELEEVRGLGADVVIAMRKGGEAFEMAVKSELGEGVDVVLDYIYGESLRAILVAVAKSSEDGKVTRVVHIGAAGGVQTMELPGHALRAAAITLMGSGLGSVPQSTLLSGIQKVFEMAGPAGLKIATKTAPLESVGERWAGAEGKPRLVFTVS